MTRIEIHLTEAEVKALDKIAKLDGRSRKNFCETEIRKIVQSLMQADEFLDNSFQNESGILDFGTRIEHRGKKTLREFLLKNGVDLNAL
jgi:hypothetical protein